MLVQTTKNYSASASCNCREPGRMELLWRKGNQTRASQSISWRRSSRRSHRRHSNNLVTLHARFISISRLQASRQLPKEYINAEGGKDQPLTLSLWKGRNTNRPRNRRAPVLREMTSGVSRPQVVLATDLATAVRLENDCNLLDFSPSTLLEDLRPAKQLACTTALETTFLLPADREGDPCRYPGSCSTGSHFFSRMETKISQKIFSKAQNILKKCWLL